MKNLALILLLFISDYSVYTQTFDEIPEEEDKSELKRFDRYSRPERYPKYPGGEDKLYSFIKTNLNMSCIDFCMEGKVYVCFTIDTTGKIANINIQRPFCEPCDEEAKRVVSIMPDWEPGYFNNKKFAFNYHLPIIFKKE